MNIMRSSKHEEGIPSAFGAGQGSIASFLDEVRAAGHVLDAGRSVAKEDGGG